MTVLSLLWVCGLVVNGFLITLDLPGNGFFTTCCLTAGVVDRISMPRQAMSKIPPIRIPQTKI